MVELSVLKDIGLTEKEARIYLVLLELGSGTVQQIARHANLKRTGLYLILEALVKKNYIIETPSRGVKKYAPQDPELILKDFQSSERKFLDLLPVFNAKYFRAAKPQVKFYEGEERLRWVYEKLIFSKKEIYFYGFSFSSLQALFPDIPKRFEEEVIIPGRYKRVLDLVMNVKEDVHVIKKIARINPRVHQVRVLPKQKIFKTDNAIVDDSLFIVSLEKLFCVHIKSSEIAESYKELFLFAWDHAKKI